MVPTLAPGRTTAVDQWWSPSAIDHTIAVPDIGTAARIMCGSPGIGAGETASRSGSAVITSYADIDWANKEPQLAVCGLESVFPGILNDRLSQAQRRQPKTHRGCKAA
jgi:hypothetical protein